MPKINAATGPSYAVPDDDPDISTIEETACPGTNSLESEPSSKPTPPEPEKKSDTRRRARTTASRS